jgi:hypothetical protein
MLEVLSCRGFLATIDRSAHRPLAAAWGGRGSPQEISLRLMAGGRSGGRFGRIRLSKCVLAIGSSPAPSISQLCRICRKTERVSCGGTQRAEFWSSLGRQRKTHREFR